MDQAELRKLPNDLFEARLVKYRRARDENIGWYKYFWRVTDEPLDALLNDRKA
jgi:transcription initiation factor TFIIE subunit alpha